MFRRLFRGRTSKQGQSQALSPGSAAPDEILKDAMTAQKSVDFHNLEKNLVDPCAMPMPLPLEFLKFITCGFSEERELGRGAFGVVYKGVLGNGKNGKTIAVKKLKDTHQDNNQFNKEVTYLIGLKKHENIVQLMGYCLESKGQANQLSDGTYVIAEVRDRLICFEYLNKKSLDKYLSAESSGLEWHIIYQIVKGICCGLHYLHKECNIIHLDLKPQNILMDDNMVPKIADFGISRLFGEQQSRIITRTLEGTLGYMAPEYLKKGLISTKSDIFSFGVIIIELLIGSKDYPENSTEASFRDFIKNVVEKWRSRFEKASKYEFEIYSQQVKACTVIGLRCVDSDHKKRPAALEIIEILNEAESKVLPPQIEASWSWLTSDVEVKVSSWGQSHSENVRYSYGVAYSPGARASMNGLYEARLDYIDGEIVGMVGIYDGYDGVKAAEYAKQHLFSNLIKHPKFLTDTKAAIVETYAHIDSEFLKADSSQIEDGGSTALTATIVGDRLIVANVGDCRAVICKGGQAIAVSRDHRPDQTDERQRIEDSGGFVLWRDGTWRVAGILDVSRAFGYKLLKQYVISDPEIKEEKVDSSLEFLILASAGLWDVVTNEEAVAMAKPFQDPQEAANKLVIEASRRGSSRSSIIVAIVHFLDETTGDKLG